jgi:hypothetical protein
MLEHSCACMHARLQSKSTSTAERSVNAHRLSSLTGTRINCIIIWLADKTGHLAIVTQIFSFTMPRRTCVGALTCSQRLVRPGQRARRSRF